jgi:probable HAF family extracellular repeat protein
MNSSKPFAILHAAAWLGLASSLSGQNFKLDPIRYDKFGGLVQLRWESQLGRIYSLHSSTNLATWEEVTGNDANPLRILAANGSRTQIELQVPAGNHRFWRVGARPLTILGTPITDGYPAVLSDVNDSARVVGYFQTRSGGLPYGFTWAPGEEMVSFGV